MNVVLLVLQERQGSVEKQDSRAHLDRQDQVDLQDLLDQLENQDQEVREVLLDQWVRWANQAHLDQQALQARLVPMESGA